jgi:hypothetical protein
MRSAACLLLVLSVPAVAQSQTAEPPEAVTGEPLPEGGPQDTATPAPEPARGVLVIGPRTRERSIVLSALSGQTSDLPVELWAERPRHTRGRLRRRLAWAAGRIESRDALCAVFWDARRTRWNLYVVGGEGHRVLTRSLVPRGEAHYEELAIIVRNAVRALLEGEVIGVDPSEIEEPDSEADSAPTTEPRPAPLTHRADQRAGPVGLSASWAPQVVSSDAGLLHALSLELLVRIDPVVFFAAYRVFQTLGGRNELASVDVSRHPIGLGARLEVPLGHLHVGLVSELVLDVMTHRAEGLDPGVRILDSSAEITFSGSLLGRTEYRFTPALSLFLALGAEVFFDRPRYTLRTASGSQVLVELWQLQPRGLVGLEVDAW